MRLSINPPHAHAFPICLNWLRYAAAGLQFPMWYEPICILRWPASLRYMLHRTMCGCRLMIEYIARIGSGDALHRIINFNVPYRMRRETRYACILLPRDCISAFEHVRRRRLCTRMPFRYDSLLCTADPNRIDWYSRRDCCVAWKAYPREASVRERKFR